MERNRILHEDEPLFEKAWNILTNSFPANEVPPKDRFTQLLKSKSFHCDTYINNNEVVGIIFWYDFIEFIYVGHFAIDENKRGAGLGTDALLSFISETKAPIIIEVEKPELAEDKEEEELRERRISFYLRNGLRFNPHEYSFPAYDEEGSDLPLYILSYPDFVDVEFARKLKEEYVPKIV